MPELVLWRHLPSDEAQFSRGGDGEVLENVDRIHMGTSFKSNRIVHSDPLCNSY